MKEIIGYSNYTLDEYGNVYSRFVKGGGGSVGSTYSKLSPVEDQTGYYIVNLISDEGVKVKVSVHRLVALTFLDNPDGKPQVNHKDGCKTNNHVDNLEWCTPLENTRHAISLGLSKPHLQAGKRVVKVCLDTGRPLKTYNTTGEASRHTRVPQPNITKVCRGVRKSAGGFGWRYLQTSETIS